MKNSINYELHKVNFSFRKRRQNLLIFRNFTILLVALVLLPAGVSAQKGNVSVNINNGTVKTFIKEIEKQTRYTFVYRNNVLNDQAKVTVNCKTSLSTRSCRKCSLL